MKRVLVKASKEYEVLIGRGLLQRSGELIAGVKKPCKAAIITDDLVDALYRKTVEASLLEAGYETAVFVFPHGEKSKNLQTFGSILEFLAARAFTRSDLVIALGGGVTGDMAGFAAACYLRGVDYVQIPTTFLSAIDSSVGGKTAIDLEAGKNLAGAFYQPRLVICDCDTFSSLSEEIFADGSAEAIKYGILAPTKLFSLFEAGKVKENIEDIVCECVCIKRDIVAQDEFDLGLRQLLNLGHTVGHAIEKLSRYEITHGHAVAAGTAIAARMSEAMGLLSKEERLRMEATLSKNGLPIRTDYGAEALSEAACADKKRKGDEITLILPEKIGQCRLEKIPVRELEKWIEAGL